MNDEKKHIKQRGTILKSGVDTWKNLRTGEEVDVSEILKPIGRQGFMITYLGTIIEMIETLGNKKMQVVKHILQNMEKSTNTYLTSTRELEAKTGISRKTIVDTLKLLEGAQIITRRLGAIMIHPHLVHRGKESKEKALLTRFYKFNEGAESELTTPEEPEASVVCQKEAGQ